MKYSDVQRITRQEAEIAFRSGTSAEICDALIRLVYHDPDWRWLQETCIEFSKHPDSAIAGLAVTCFGHIARIHRTLEVERVVEILNERSKNPEVAGRVSDALDDINIYLRPTQERIPPGN